MRHSTADLKINNLKDKMRLHPDVTRENLPHNYNQCMTAYYSFEQKVQEVHGNKYSLKFTTYKNARAKIKVYCKACKKLFSITTSNFRKGQGCRDCAIRALTRTQEQYISELKLANPYVELVGTYINALEPVEHKCLICSTVSKAKPIHKLRGHKNNCCKPNSHHHLSDVPAKLYTLKIQVGRRVAYKIGVTTSREIVGGMGRYARKQDRQNISEVSYIQLDTMQEALEIERGYKYHNNQNEKYRGKRMFACNTGNSELFKYPINLLDIVKECNPKKYINCRLLKER